MKKTSDYFKEYENIYNRLEKFQIVLHEPQSIMEMRLDDDEWGIPQVRLKLINTSPEFMEGDLRFSVDRKIDLLLEKIIADFIDRSFDKELINSEFINIHFPGYIETSMQNLKSRFTLGRLQDYDKFDFMARKVFANHNENILLVPKETSKVIKLTQ